MMKQILLTACLFLGSSSFSLASSLRSDSALERGMDQASLLAMELVSDGGSGGQRLKDWVRESDYTLVLFWASFCSPCVKKLQALEEAPQRWGLEGAVRVVPIMIDQNRAKMDKIYKSKGLKLPKVHIKTASIQSMFQKPIGVPLWVLFRKTSSGPRPVFVKVGPLDLTGTKSLGKWIQENKRSAQA